MDPERPIEKLLRQAAEARRVQAGSPELHAVNRRMLQGEIARKFASAAPQKRSFFELFMPRIAWSAAMLIGLGLATSLMLPRHAEQPKEMFFAKNDRASAPDLMKERLPSGAAAEKPSAPLQTPAVAAADQSARMTDAVGAPVAQAERDKDSFSFEARKTEPEKKQLALNEPAAAPPATMSGGSLATVKQKEELASRALRAAVPPKSAMPSEEMTRRQYGSAAPTQPAPSSAAAAGANAYGGETRPGVAGADQPNSTLASARAELAKAATSTSSFVASQTNAAAFANVARRSPAPLAQVAQQFVRADALARNIELADKSATAKPILASFELRQIGRQVRIVDSDGSIYTGNFELPKTFDFLDSETQQKGDGTSVLKSAASPANRVAPSENAVERHGALDDAKLQADLSYAFTVTGTNQTLNQLVTFTGQILTPTNVLSVLGPAGTLNGNRAAPPELNPLPLGNSRVSGKALIGTNREIEVNAVPAH